MTSRPPSATPSPGLRIGVDARVLDERYHGIGRSTYELLVAATAAHPEWEFVLFTNRTQRTDRFDLDALTSRPGVHTASFDHELTAVGQYLRWPAALRAARVDVALFPYHLGAALSGRARRFAIVHDCILEADPRFAPDRRTRLLYMLLTAAVVRRTRVLTPSRASADDIARIYRLGRARARLGVVRWGVGDAFAAEVPAPTEVNGLSIDGPYLLHVGARRPHKNVGHLVRVLHRLPAEYRLVLVGSPDPRWPDDVDDLVAEHDLGDRVLQPGKVSESDLIGLYAGAAAFVYPSLIEGFGLPLLEAFAAGTPVVASDIPVFREVAEGAALLCAPDDPDAWAAAVTSLVAGPSTGAQVARRRQELVTAGRDRAAGATWGRAVQDLAGALDPSGPRTAAAAAPPPAPMTSTTAEKVSR